MNWILILVLALTWFGWAFVAKAMLVLSGISLLLFAGLMVLAHFNQS